VAFVNARPKPLAMYLFTGSGKLADDLVARTTAGGTCINDTVLQFAHPGLPGGGVNASGIGKAHGKFGFDTFSNQRAVLKSSRWYSPAQFLYPPFERKTHQILHLLLKFF
jgi:aldehyde dehydrogenase (NAD+)